MKIVDRDGKSPGEITEASQRGIRVLEKRNIESYLLDDEIISKLCALNNNQGLIPQAIAIKTNALASSVARGNPTDDVKSAAGEIYVDLVRLLQLTASGNTKDAFLRDTIAPLITEDTEIYRQLESEIIHPEAPTRNGT